MHDSAAKRFTPGRMAVLLVAACFTVPPVLVTLLAAGLSPGTAQLVTAAIHAAGVLWVFRAPWPPISYSGGRRVLFLVWMALSLFAAYRVASLSVFMFDATRTDYASRPAIRDLDDPDLAKPFFPKHNCFTCYVIAARLASDGVDNVYASDQYRNPKTETDIHRTIGETLTIDRYQYPPPFLLLPRLLLATGGDFFAWRAYWFAQNVLVFGVTAVALLAWMTRGAFGASWFVIPAVLIAPVTLGTLQIGNVHFLMICISVLAMWAFERKREWLGGALLGFAVVSKIFPGVLLVYLIFRRRFAAIGKCVAAMILLCLLTLMVFGPQPFRSFFAYQLPRLASGEAFSFAFERIAPLMKNASITGAVYKFATLGWLGDADAGRVARVVSWIYTAAVLIAAAVAGLRHRRVVSADPADPGARLALARVWLALLVLAQLRSPFLPWGYGNVVVLWLLAWLTPQSRPWLWPATALAAGWLLAAANLPLPFGPPSVDFDLYWSLLAFAACLLVCVVLVIRRRAPAGVHEATGRPVFAAEDPRASDTVDGGVDR
ncbi:MAG: glycosyltransferase family 87 protein [Phycisphaerae bacterium]